MNNSITCRPDWFEHLTGFKERDYRDTQSKLEVVGTTLRSKVNGAAYGIGSLELAPLHELRDRVAAGPALPGRLQVTIVQGDVRAMHRRDEYAGALFQVASQFNLLEMTSPNVTPEQGVTRYAGDPTQGPACAIAAGAATLYRNYFAPVGDQIGQTRDRQLDGLAGLGASLATATGLTLDALWQMRNGYALCTGKGLDAITTHLAALDESARDSLRGQLCIGLHHDVEVTGPPYPTTGSSVKPVVSQAFCSALPVAYGDGPAQRWRALATLVLEAAYEATMLVALSRAQSGKSNVVLLTSLGGGAFGNDETWIFGAMRRALRLVEQRALDVKVVSYGEPSAAMCEVVESFG